ncbi:unnamed protein product [Trichobilharzia regenti]|nr:unnamed protein product [Trichobilharzia regenti]
MNSDSLVFCDKIPFKILPGLVCFGRLLDNRLLTVFVAASEKVYIYNPKFYHTADGITKVLSQGKFEQISDNNDLLIIGSKTGILLYDPKNNIDIFYKELKNDGVNTIVYKHFEKQQQQQQHQQGQLSYQKYKDSDVILVGGNCTLTVLNYSGLELFWTVTGEAISSLTCLSYENTEEYFNDIIIGSEDYSIRVFRGDLIIHEISETDVRLLILI